MLSLLSGFPLSGSLGTTLAFVGLSGLSGLLAAIVMDVPMVRQEEGFTPAYIAASVFRRSSPDDVSEADAYVVHHGAGVFGGVLYAVAYLLLAATLPPVVSMGVVSVLPHVLASVAVAVFVYAFFAHVLLPRSGARVYEERSTAVRGQWLRSSFVFGLTIAVSLPVLVSSL